MYIAKRTNSKDQDFVSLVAALDKYLTEVDGEEHAFYDQFNKIDLIEHAVVVYLRNEPVGCGAIKKYQTDVWELKRMYVLPAYRGKGAAVQIINELEGWAKALGVKNLILETGKRQADAVAFYHKMAYQVCPNFGQYIGVENSVCFEKSL